MRTLRYSKYFFYGLVALAAISSGLYFGAQKFNPVPAQTTFLFQQTLPDSQGQTQALAQWCNKILVVNFWAPWCPPCVEELPELAALQRQMQHKNVQFISIGIDSSTNIGEFLSKNKNIDYPLLVAGITGIEISRQLGNLQGGLPYTVVIDQRGHIKHQKAGRVNLAELSQWLTIELSAEENTGALNKP